MEAATMKDNDNIWDIISKCIIVYALFYILGLVVKGLIILIFSIIKLFISLIKYIYNKSYSWIASRKEKDNEKGIGKSGI
jgi:hypothetical protein